MSFFNAALTVQMTLKINQRILERALKLSEDMSREVFLTIGAYQAAPLEIAKAFRDFSKVSKGENGPVLILPGFCASDTETIPLRAYLTAKGYSARGWKDGRNLGLSKKTCEKASDRIKKLNDKYGEATKIVGWSLGGVLARHIANTNPDEVSLVVTAGTPANQSAHTGDDVLPAVRAFYEALNGATDSSENMTLLDQAIEPLQQPCSVIITEDDLIVSEEASIPDEALRTDGRNIGPQEIIKISREAGVTHCGLMAHWLAMRTIENRLAEDPNDWNPINAATNPLGRHKHIERVPIAA